MRVVTKVRTVYHVSGTVVVPLKEGGSVKMVFEVFDDDNPNDEGMLFDTFYDAGCYRAELEKYDGC